MSEKVEKKEPVKVWDENGHLVHPELKQRYLDEEKKVLGIDQPETKVKPETDEEKAEREKEYVSREDVTGTPLNNPQPVSASYAMPPKIGIHKGDRIAGGKAEADPPPEQNPPPSDDAGGQTQTSGGEKKPPVSGAADKSTKDGSQA